MKHLAMASIAHSAEQGVAAASSSCSASPGSTGFPAGFLAAGCLLLPTSLIKLAEAL